MGRRDLPVIIGCYDKADKVAMWTWSKGLPGRTLIIARLRDRFTRGDTDVPIEAIESICCELHFCNKETLRVFITAAKHAYDNWEGEEDGA